jgi:hypothetical protein
MAYNKPDDDLAYGSYHGQGQPEGEQGERGFIGDVGKRLFGGGRRQDQPVSASLFLCLARTSTRAYSLPPCTCSSLFCVVWVVQASGAHRLVVTALNPRPCSARSQTILQFIPLTTRSSTNLAVAEPTAARLRLQRRRHVVRVRQAPPYRPRYRLRSQGQALWQ